MLATVAIHRPRISRTIGGGVVSVGVGVTVVSVMPPDPVQAAPHTTRESAARRASLDENAMAGNISQ
jgi:hypothetical protein